MYGTWITKGTTKNHHGNAEMPRMALWRGTNGTNGIPNPGGKGSPKFGSTWPAFHKSCSKQPLILESSRSLAIVTRPKNGHFEIESAIVTATGQVLVLFHPMPRWCLSWSCSRPEREEASLQQKSLFARNMTQHDTGFAPIIIIAPQRIKFGIEFVFCSGKRFLPTWKSNGGINPLRERRALQVQTISSHFIPSYPSPTWLASATKLAALSTAKRRWD